MSDFAPGDLVECVDAGPHPAALDYGPLRNVRQGRVYRIEDIFFDAAPPDPGTVLTLAGVVCECWSGGYSAWRFRKLNDGTDDAELIARIKSCPPRIETPVLYPSHKEVWPPEVWEEMEAIRRGERL